MSRKGERVVLGMSGGVDSSAAAWLLLEQGYRVIGVTMNNGSTDPGDAASVCAALGIEHHVIDFQAEFKYHVIDYFVNEYYAGKTPNPCVVCNRQVKWPALIMKADDFGAKTIATGHYAYIGFDETRNRYVVRRSGNAKDQSYALSGLNQEQLSRTVTPLYSYTKEEVREIAAKSGLFVSGKPDSQENCFIPDNDHRGFLAQQNKPAKPGFFVDSQGNILGKHDGIHNFTVGQRKGLGIALGRPVFVKNIDHETAAVTLVDNDALLESKLTAGSINYVSSAKILEKQRLAAKIRYSHREAACIAEVIDGRLFVAFDQPQRAVTPGQTIVLYDGDYVVCGARIE